MSPDGSVLYLQGSDETLNAVNSNDGSVLWQLPTGYNYDYQGIMVDNQGNIYYNIKDSTGVKFSCIDPSGNMLWQYPRLMGSMDCVMDWDGYIYFFDFATLHALDNLGQIRWERRFSGGDDFVPVICDGENVIYVQTREGCIYGVNQNGDIVFEKCLVELYTDMGAIGQDGCLYCSISVMAYMGLGYDCYLVALE